MSGAWRLYRAMVAGSMRARMQYKFDFLFTNFAYAIIFAVEFVAVGALLYRFQAIGGWDIYEIALLFGISGTAMGLVRTFLSELMYFERYIIQGDFDALMVRPWPTLLQLVTANVDPGRLGAVAQGLVITYLGIHGLMAKGLLSVVALLYLPLLCLIGAAIFAAILLATSALAFWVQRVDELTTFTVHAPYSAGTFPLLIYPRWIQQLLTTLLPVAYVNYIPVRYLIGRGGSASDLALPPAVALIALVLAYLVWRAGERRYQSTGN